MIFLYIKLKMGFPINLTDLVLCLGDIFHAAPNVDHSQDFVRRDIKEWLKWLRNDIGFDGWRLDFVRWRCSYCPPFILTCHPFNIFGTRIIISSCPDNSNKSYGRHVKRKRNLIASMLKFLHSCDVGWLVNVYASLVHKLSQYVYLCSFPFFF